MRIRIVTFIIFSVCMFGAKAANAQWSHIDFSAGAGFTEPEGHAGSDLNTGWNLDFRGGYKPMPHLALDLDFNYNRWSLNNTALARYGEPGGTESIWSFSFTPMLRGSPRWHVSPYILGGPGIYYRNLSLTQPALVNTVFCDFFFGFCYPAVVGVNQVVASSTTYKFGYSAGAGLEFPLGQIHAKVFGEARYSRMFTTNGADRSFVPVTFGLRW
jgi:opacity protein-like surface antigen